MKKLFLFGRLAFVAAVVLCMISCGSSADYRNILPADAFMVGSFNGASLQKKSGAGNPEQNPLYVKLTEKLQADASMTAEKKAMVASILKDPSQSGIDLSADSYFFLQMKGEVVNPQQGAFGMLMKMGDKKKFEALLAEASDEKVPVKEAGFEMITVGEGAQQVMLAWNDDACLFFATRETSENALAALRGMMTQKKEQSMLSVDLAKTFFEGKNDINFYISMSNLPGETFKAMPASMVDAYKKMAMVMSCNFETGKIVGKVNSVYADKEAEKQMLAFADYSKPMTGALAKYLPAVNLGMMGMNIDGKKLYENMKEIPEYAQLMAMPMAQQLIEALSGDIVLVFNGMSAGGQFPVASLLAQVSNPAIVDELVSQFGMMMPVTKTTGGGYSLPLGPVALSLGVKDGVLYVTTDPAMEKAVMNGGAADPQPFPFKGDVMAMTLDLAGLGGLVTEVAPMDAKPFAAFLGIFGTMTASMNMTEGDMEITMQNKDVNALQSIVGETSRIVSQMQ